MGIGREVCDTAGTYTQSGGVVLLYTVATDFAVWSLSSRNWLREGSLSVRWRGSSGADW